MSLSMIGSFFHGNSAGTSCSNRTLIRLLAILYRPLGWACEQVAIRRAGRELLELPDSMLADMGITRGEIDSIVRYGRSDLTRHSEGRI